jgi:hypothetical protein
MYKYAMQKYFYETMKYKKMNNDIFIFLCLHSKYFLQGFLRSVKIIHMGLKFLFIFLMQVLESEYANAKSKYG